MWNTFNKRVKKILIFKSGSPGQKSKREAIIDYNNIIVIIIILLIILPKVKKNDSMLSNQWTQRYKFVTWRGKARWGKGDREEGNKGKSGR